MTNEFEDGESAADSYPGVRNTELVPIRRGKFDIITAIPICGNRIGKGHFRSGTMPAGDPHRKGVG